MIVLGIETSCDETGLALYHRDKGLLGHKLFSQIKLHAMYGGVVPELASRDHILRLLPLLEQLLAACKLGKSEIDAIAYTQGPGLLGALLTGASFAQSLAWALGVPALGVHHMEGHLLAAMLEQPAPEFPFLALLVSGGHTMLVKVNAHGDYQKLGESLDDAAGEAFDKTARLLDLPYPGGPAIAKLATGGNSAAYKFPRPMLDKPGFDFSFSGLKTAVLTQVQKTADLDAAKADLAASFQAAAVDVLCQKTVRALRHSNLQQLVVAGGVGANMELRQKLKQLGAKHNVAVFYPRLEFCTDNGAMIAYAGAMRLGKKESSPLAIDCKARWDLSQLQAPQPPIIDN